RAQPEAHTQTWLLGGEKRLEDPVLYPRRDPGTGIPDLEEYVTPRLDRVGGPPLTPLRQFNVARRDRQTPASRHRVPRIQDQVHHDLLELAGIGDHTVQTAR